MKKDFEGHSAYSIDNPTAAYPRENMASLFDSEESDVDAVTPEPLGARTNGTSFSWFYLGVAMLGGSLLALGVAGIIVLLAVSV